MAIATQAKYVARGFGQVEPNHLSAPQSGRVYAQLPADASIDILENGQFVKYDYAKGVVDFDGPGAWMMVFNEVKIYRDFETDADFAMIKKNYNARVYSPVGQNSSEIVSLAQAEGAVRVNSTEDYTYGIPKFTYPQPMPEGTKMVPRVLHIEVGDIWTTNLINNTKDEIEAAKVGADLKLNASGILELGTATGGDLNPKFQIVKIYTMPDNQPGVKVMRVA